jgi:hypothetical protein
MKLEIKEYIRQYLLPENSKMLLSLACFALGLFSILSSLIFFIIFLPTISIYKSIEILLVILFVGLWAPTLIGVANFLKK